VATQSALPALSTQHAHLRNPFLTSAVAAFNHTYQACLDRADTDETKDVARQAREAMGAKVPAIDEGWHAHGDDNARRLPGEQLLRHAAGSVLKGEAWPQYLLQESLKQRWHRAEPQGLEDHQVISPADCFCDWRIDSEGCPCSQSSLVRRIGKRLRIFTP
jgi:hypothetical protein